MAFAALTNVVDKVTKLLSSNDNFFISAAENELQELKSELSLLKAWFGDMSKRGKEENEVFREVERQIMEVAYIAEDAVDSSLAQARESIRLAPLAFNHVSFLARDIRSLREDTVKPVFDMYARMLLGDRSAVGVDHDRRETQRELPPLIKQENIIGFEHEEKTIIEYLKETTEELDVISIIGMAGLGKTTLAWKIYENGTTCYEFPIRIWVYASKVFERKNVFLKILTHFTSQDMTCLSYEELAHRVYWSLEKEKFLLVIDDVCSVDDWNAIRYVLPNNCNGKVLITSRYTNVGKHANPTREPLRLGFLTKEQSSELLQYEVFRSLNDCNRELMEIGEYIAKQCEGLLLAIMHMG